MKYLKHISGFILIAFGIVGVIRTQLGASPIDAFNYYLFVILRDAGLSVTLGTVIFIIGTLATILTYILTKDKRLIFSFIFLTLLSLVVDGWNALFGLLPEVVFELLIYRMITAGVAFFMMCFGVAITMSTGLPMLPYERLLLHIDKKRDNISVSKIFIDGTFFVLAIALGLYLQRLTEQVFVMTFIIAFFTGVFVNIFLKFIKKDAQKGVVIHETK